MPQASEIQILLVEDTPEDAELMLRALKKGQVTNHCHHVEDGAAALDFLFREGDYASRPDQNPKVILLDLKLPRVDGMEVLRRVKRDPRTKSVPVVVLTSSRESKDLEEAYQIGVNSYVVKPVDFEQFTEAMERLGHYWNVLNVIPDEGT
jgi:two-component system, response regulator